VILVFVLFRYALKTIKKAKVKRADYLRREIDLLLTVNHPNIINVVDVFEDKFNLQVYIFMF
jgi:serine/threonine protein kinase